MASTYSSLKFELIGTGDQSGTWGTTTNVNLGTAIEEAITGSADVPFASADVTLTLTNTNTTQTARNLRLNLTGTSGGARNLTVPDIEKFYIIANNLADDVTVKNSTGTTYTIPAGKIGQVFSTGTGIKAGSSFFEGQILSNAAYILGGEIEATPIGAISSSTGAFTTLSASSLTLVTPLAVAQGGTGVATITGIVKGSGTSAFTAATAGTDYTSPTGAENLSNKTITASTLNSTPIGASSASTGAFTSLTANAVTSLGETTTISATAATGTINYDVITQGVVYYTSSAAANWAVNFRGNGSTTLNSLMAVGETRTVTFMVTQGATPYYNTGITIDSNPVTPVWQGGAAPTVGNANSIDIYTYSIIKTASATFTVLAAQTQFK